MARCVRLLSLLALGVAVLVVSLAGEATAGRALTPAPGAPDPKLMVLTSADLGGAKVTKQGYYRDQDFPSVISYSRELEDGRFAGAELLYVDSEAEIGRSAATTASFLASFRALLGTKAGKKLLADSFKQGIPASGVVTNVTVGSPRRLGAGAGSFDVPVVARVLGVRIELHLSAFRVAQVLGSLVAVGTPGKRLPLTTMTRLARIMTTRMTAQLAPRNTALPTIAGTAAIGQTLTATPGTWSGPPTSFSYQWQRCDANGAACSAITGATGQTYVVATGDAGATLRVAVTARNSVGSSTASSAQTALVQAAGAPVNVSPPTITGTAAVGQTLTAGTGTWSGGPTSYGFQWQRCDASGASCVAVAGATGGTYVVVASDVGSTLRVVVTATNAAGGASATSAQTATVT